MGNDNVQVTSIR
uniref:Uncharacterized protein n=1 Tax=Anguilla anguilla TaxID=7936 RepID=A0A0E9WAI0_ANGAN